MRERERERNKIKLDVDDLTAICGKDTLNLPPSKVTKFTIGTHIHEGFYYIEHS